jgi:Iap family predicted aminopeptidase
MISYFITTISTIFFGILFYKIDGYNIVKEYISVKKNKLKNLYNLVSTRHTSKFIIVLISTEMLFQSFYQSLVQYLDNSVKKIGKNKYELKYVINGKLYKKIIIPERGPLPVVSITNENNDDVTEYILPYIGPNNNFHNENFNPNFFDYKILKFEMSNGTIKIFNDFEIIIF